METQCKMWIESKGTLTAKKRKFDKSLRAPPYRSYNKSVVFAPDYYDEASVSVKKCITSDGVEQLKHGEGESSSVSV